MVRGDDAGQAGPGGPPPALDGAEGVATAATLFLGLSGFMGCYDSLSGVVELLLKAGDVEFGCRAVECLRFTWCF